MLFELNIGCWNYGEKYNGIDGQTWGRGRERFGNRPLPYHVVDMIAESFSEFLLRIAVRSSLIFLRNRARGLGFCESRLWAVVGEISGETCTGKAHQVPTMIPIDRN